MVVTVFDRDRVADYQRMVSQLRSAGIRAEMYLGSGKFGPQMKYADKRNSPCVVIQGGDEKLKNEVQIKDLILGAGAHRDQGPRRISEEAGRGAVRGRRGQAGRGGAPGAGPPRREVRSLNPRYPAIRYAAALNLFRLRTTQLRGTNLLARNCIGASVKIFSREVAMGSPWDFAIAQTMQRHGGSNRPLPKAAQPKLCSLAAPEQPADGSDAADPAPQSRDEAVPRSRRIAAEAARATLFVRSRCGCRSTGSPAAHAERRVDRMTEHLLGGVEAVDHGPRTRRACRRGTA